MGINSLRPGIDPDETWRYWREKHTVWAKEKTFPELRKYTVSKVIYTFGPVDIYAVAQLWFDDVESAQRAIGRVISAPPDELLAKRVNPPQRIIVQEEEIEL